MAIQTKRESMSPRVVTTGEAAEVEAMVASGADVVRRPLGGQGSEQIRAARTVIVAAKAAYQFKSPRWLTLFSNAMAAIERCPAEVHSRLKDELCVFHPQWHKRPKAV